MKFILKMVISTACFVIGCFLFISTDSEAGVVKTWEESYDVGSGGTLYIESDLGSISIESNTGNKVEIEVTAKLRTNSESKAEDILEDFKLEFEQDGDDVSIFAEFKNRNIWSIWGSRGASINLEFHVSVPKEYNLDLYTAGGSIEVDDLTGEVRVETSGGSLDFENINGIIEAKTSGGSITLAGCTGDVDVKTSGGSITIGEVKGDVQAHTSGGSIRIDEVMGILNASTSGGSITAKIDGQPEDDCRLSTSGGSVTVYLNRNINIDIDASTSAGHVETDFPVTIRGKVRKSSLKGQVNEGGPELYLRTSAGNINILEI
ncbi:MAG: DUF4097 family beta strand repeat-containing protein [Candidatus Zixiibacteriota bacterium]